MTLVAKQEAFCLQYLQDCNPELAAVRAGYSEGRSGYVLMQMPEILKRIAELNDARVKDLTVDQAWVINQLRAVFDRCMEGEPVVDKTGRQIYDFADDGELRPLYKFNAAGANKALELIGKALGMFVDKVEHSGTISSEEMSENEKLRRFARTLESALPMLSHKVDESTRRETGAQQSQGSDTSRGKGSTSRLN